MEQPNFKTGERVMQPKEGEGKWEGGSDQRETRGFENDGEARVYGHRGSR